MQKEELYLSKQRSCLLYSIQAILLQITHQKSVWHMDYCTPPRKQTFSLFSAASWETCHKHSLALTFFLFDWHGSMHSAILMDVDTQTIRPSKKEKKNMHTKRLQWKSERNVPSCHSSSEEVCTLAGDCDDGGMAQAQINSKTEWKKRRRKETRQWCDGHGSALRRQFCQ